MVCQINLGDEQHLLDEYNGTRLHPLAWVLDTPNHVRQLAVREFTAAYSANMKKAGITKRSRTKKAKNGRRRQTETKQRRVKFFRMQYRRKKAPRQSISIPQEGWMCRKRSVFHDLFGLDETKGTFNLRAAAKLPATMEHAFKVMRTRTNRWFLCVCEPTVKRGDDQAPSLAAEDRNGRIIALDPGVRTFLTGYDPSGKVYEFGKGDIDRIESLCKWLGTLQRKWSNKQLYRHKQRWNMRRAWYRMIERIRNLVDEVHKKTALWLCRNYRWILLPPFETSRMTKRRRRRIRAKTARQMYTWSHYRFRMWLKQKAQQHQWCHVVEVREDYTSKTCGRCGAIHWDLGGDKTFRCPLAQCGYVADRDISASRNILIRTLTDAGISVPAPLLLPFYYRRRRTSDDNTPRLVGNHGVIHVGLALPDDLASGIGEDSGTRRRLAAVNDREACSF